MLDVLVQLSLLPPDIDNGTIIEFDVYLGTVDARNLSSADAAMLTRSVENIKVQLQFYARIN